MVLVDRRVELVVLNPFPLDVASLEVQLALGVCVSDQDRTDRAGPYRLPALAPSVVVVVVGCCAIGTQQWGLHQGQD